MTDSCTICGMSRSGNVWDNAAMESFFSLLMAERIMRKSVSHQNKTSADAFEYIKWLNNAIRRSTIRYMNPVEFERQTGSA